VTTRSRFLKGLVSTQLSVDPRTLGATRIALALLLLFDLGKRTAELATWYSNSGLLPNHTLLWRPVRQWQMSFLWMFSYWQEVAIAFFAIALVYLALLVGYRTRLAQVLSLLCLISLQVRVDLLSNGGDIVVCTLLWWTLFLPLGERFSLDAIARSLRFGAETPAQVRSFAARPRTTTPHISLAVLAAMLQLSVIYFFNAASKQGVTWYEGSAIHYFLQQERILTPLGLIAREHLPYVITQWLSYATLVVEGILPLLILSPWGRPWTRRIAILLLVGLHTNIALMSNLGVFSPAMCVFGTLLVSRADWDALGAWARGRRRRTVFYDSGCGICFQLARILARVDLFARLDLRASRDARSDELPKGFAPDSLADTLLVLDAETGRTWVKSAAWAQVIRSLPLGFLFGWIGWLLRLPGLGSLCDRAYEAFARNRAAISEFLGYAACEIPATGASQSASAQFSPPARKLETESRTAHTGWTRWRQNAGVGLREAALLFLIFVATAQVLHENSVIPEPFRIKTLPRWIAASISYTRLYQGWRMFAPDAPVSEMNVIVEAKTLSGRFVDPIRAASEGSHEVKSDRIAVQPGPSVYWADYLHRIEGRGSYHGPLRDWILAYHERTGNPDDRILSFVAAVIEQDSPAPGEKSPTRVRSRVFLQGP